VLPPGGIDSAWREEPEYFGQQGIVVDEAVVATGLDYTRCRLVLVYSQPVIKRFVACLHQQQVIVRSGQLRAQQCANLVDMRFSDLVWRVRLVEKIDSHGGLP